MILGSDLLEVFSYTDLLCFLAPLNEAKKAWHSPEALSQSEAAGIWGSSLQLRSALATPF